MRYRKTPNHDCNKDVSMTLSRRDFSLAMGSLLAACGVDELAPATPADRDGPAASSDTAALASEPSHPLQIGMLIYPGFTAQDFVGPQLAFAGMGNVQIHVLWKDTTNVTCDTGFGIGPTAALSACPSDLDILFVPGGIGAFRWMNDLEIIEFLQARGSCARFVTSVCNGSLLLAAAGLLRGYRATCHWAYKHLLPIMGGIPAAARVVQDRNRITGGGVTSGLDFGLTVSARIRGEHQAKKQQLAIEYDPQPPFDAGSPETAGPLLTAEVAKIYAANVASHAAAAVEASERLGV